MDGWTDDAPCAQHNSLDDHQNDTSVTLHVVGTSFVMLLLLSNPELIGAGVLARTCVYDQMILAVCLSMMLLYDAFTLTVMCVFRVCGI